jgi:hypothetical protein
VGPALDARARKREVDTLGYSGVYRSMARCPKRCFFVLENVLLLRLCWRSMLLDYGVSVDQWTVGEGRGGESKLVEATPFGRRADIRGSADRGGYGAVLGT